MRTAAPALVSNLDGDHRPVRNKERLRSLVGYGTVTPGSPLYISTQGNAIGGKGHLPQRSLLDSLFSQDIKTSL